MVGLSSSGGTGELKDVGASGEYMLIGVIPLFHDATAAGGALASYTDQGIVSAMIKSGTGANFDLTGATTIRYVLAGIFSLTNGGDTGYFQLYNTTDSTAVTGSETTWTGDTNKNFLYSSALTLTEGKAYKLQMKRTGSGSVYVASAYLMILAQV